jgi:hypothetical protein
MLARIPDQGHESWRFRSFTVRGASHEKDDHRRVSTAPVAVT